jgi:hypothetical protein
MTVQPPGLLGAAGPAQFEFLIHFCGRPSSAAMTPTVPQTIRDLQPWQRLHNILWEGQIRGFASWSVERRVQAYPRLSIMSAAFSNSASVGMAKSRALA